MIVEIVFKGSPVAFGRQITRCDIPVEGFVLRGGVDPLYLPPDTKSLALDFYSDLTLSYWGFSWMGGLRANMLPSGETTALSGRWPDKAEGITAWWLAFLARLRADGLIDDQNQVQAARGDDPSGPKAGTFERVNEAHRLMKNGGMSRSKAFRRARTDSRTYNRWCKAATGDDPVAPYCSE